MILPFTSPRWVALAQETPGCLQAGPTCITRSRSAGSDSFRAAFAAIPSRADAKKPLVS